MCVLKTNGELKGRLRGRCLIFNDLLMQAPIPIAMLLGREHRFAFLNTRYAELIGITSISRVLGKSMLEAFPELERQNFIGDMDRVYETGRPYVGKTCRWTFYRETSGAMEEGYFDTIYQPLTNSFGEIVGIMIQTSDVTEHVLAREVQENREQLLYRQWAELESIYRCAPIGLVLLDTKEYRVLRLNERQAEIMGGRVSDFLGKPILEAAHSVPDLPKLFERVAAGQTISNHILEGELAASPGVYRYWLVNYSPTYSADGRVEAITCVSQEITQQTKSEIEHRSTLSSDSHLYSQLSVHS